MSGHLWLAAILAAGLAGVELLRRDRTLLLLRLAAVLTATITLGLLLGHEPTAAPRRSPIRLLTPGSPARSSAPGVFTLDAVASLGDLANRIAPHAEIELDGWGLLAHEWPAQAVPQITFAPAAPPRGVGELDAPIQLAVGEPLVVKGRVTLAPGDSAWIVLEDPAAPRDSMLVSFHHPGFTLLDHPREAGAVSYRLRLGSQVDTLGIAIREAVPPTVLVLDASPSFETAYLKRWLASRGTHVVVRTTISRGRFRIEEVNGTGAAPGTLTDASLGRFDIILADGGSLVQASEAERSALVRAVRTSGTGLLLTADARRGVATGEIFSSFRLSRTAELDERRVRPVWPGAPRRSRVAIEADASVLEKGAPLALVSDETGRALAQAADAGAGRVGVTLLRAPSRWILEGENDQFAAYWSRLIRAVARDTSTRIDLRSDGPRQPDHPITISALSSERRDTAVHTGSSDLVVRSPNGTTDTVATARDPFDPRRWTGRFWPRTAGWHSVEFAGGQRLPFRVSPEGEWEGVEATARLAATRARLGRSVSQNPRLPQTNWLEPLAFLLLVLSLGWLWWEGRRRSR